MSADWVMGRVALMKEKEQKWGANSSFYYAKGKAIMDVMANRAIGNGAGLITSTSIIGDIASSEPHVFCVFADGQGAREVAYENLIDTSGMALNELGANLPYNNVLSIGVGLNKTINDDFHWWYNGINDVPIHRITLLSRYHDGMAPSGCDSLLIEIPEKEITVYPQTGMITAFLNDSGFPHRIEEKDIATVSILGSKGYPIPVLGHRHTVKAARMALAKRNIYLAGRWGAHGYYNLEHIIAEAKSVADAILTGNTADYFGANYYYKERS
jgi:hypothetical protein